MTFISLFLVWSFSSVYAQTTNEEWESIYSQANATAIFNNGQIVSIEQTIPGVGDKTFTFTHSVDNKPLTITDENDISLGITFYKDGRIQSVEMPNGERMSVVWNESTNGWIAEDIICDNDLVQAPRQSNPCRDAVAASAIALGMCTLSPGSAACWAATANAAYHTYRCYEATRLAFNSKKLQNVKIYALTPKSERNVRKENKIFRKSKVNIG